MWIRVETKRRMGEGAEKRRKKEKEKAMPTGDRARRWGRQTDQRKEGGMGERERQW